MVQQYFSDEEWLALTKSPMQALVGVLLADKADPVSFLKEAQAAVRILAAEQQRQDVANDIIKGVLAALSETDRGEPIAGEELLLKKEFEMLGQLQNLKTSAEGRQNAIAHFQKVNAILTAKVTTAQALEFKAWILDLAKQLAETTKEGGFLGIGGEKISDGEDAMLRALSEALTPKS